MTEQDNLKVARVIVLREAVRRLTTSMADYRWRKQPDKVLRLAAQLDDALAPLFDHQCSEAQGIDIEDVLRFPGSMDEKQWYAFTVYGDALATRLLLGGDPKDLTDRLVLLYARLEELCCANHDLYSMPTRWNEIDRVQQTCAPLPESALAVFERLRVKYLEGSPTSTGETKRPGPESIDHMVSTTTQVWLWPLVGPVQDNPWSVWPEEWTTINWGVLNRVAMLLAAQLQKMGR